jgi:RimJ/RimL family protein N-acetyltransferase
MAGERLRPEHAEELEVLLLDPRVGRTLWPTREPLTAVDVRSSVAAGSDHWDRHGFGLWLLRDGETGALVGRGGLQLTFVEDIHEVEAAWAIVPDRWGQGLATELALVAIDVAFDALDLPGVVAFTLPDNVASRRVMDKAGFVYERDIIHAGLPHVLYRRRADR